MTRAADLLFDTARELGYALRQLLRNPGFTLASVLTLGLGIGAAAAIFAVVNGVILEPLPFPEADRMVRVTSPVPGQGPDEVWNLSSAQFFHLREHARSIEALGAFQRGGVNVRGTDDPQRASTAIATGSTLELIGARAHRGRLFQEGEDRPGAANVAILSFEFWERHFGSDLQAVGRTLEVNEVPFEVIGVMAPDVRLPGEPGAPGSLERPDLWLPYVLDPSDEFLNSHHMLVIGRLAEGVDLERAQEEVATLTAGLPEAFPDVYAPAFMERYGFRTDLVPLKAYVVGDMAGHLWILFGAVGLVLLAAGANVANLFLVRVEGRRRELAVRSALGASRTAIARHLVAESLVLGASGGALALFVAYGSVRWLAVRAPADLPRLDSISVDPGVLLFTAGTSLVVGLGLATLTLARRGRGGVAGLGEGGRSGTVGRERQRVRYGLVAAQVALALVLLVSAGLLMSSLQQLRAVDPGIDSEGVMSLLVHLPPGRYDDQASMWRFHDALIERIVAVPGVQSAGAGGTIPLSGSYRCVIHAFEESAVRGRLEVSEGPTCPAHVPVTPGYFEALGMPLLAGRTLTRADHDQPEMGAVVVSRAFADRFWPGENPLGKGIRPGGTPPPDRVPRYYQVVGVVGDVPGASLEGPPALAAYYPIVSIPGEPAWPVESFHLLVRTDQGNPTAVVPAIRAAIREVDPTVPLAGIERLRDIEDRATGRVVFSMTLISIAAGMGLLLAAIGLYGVVAYVVARRTGEIGIRVALGAGPRQVERLVVGGSMRVVVLGLAAGTVASAVFTRLMRGILYGVEPTDIRIYLLAIAVLSGVAFAASYIPARRAARVDPREALSRE